MAGLDPTLQAALITAGAAVLTVVLGGLFKSRDTIAGDQGAFRKDLIGELDKTNDKLDRTNEKLDKIKERLDKALEEVAQRDREILRLQARLIRAGLEPDEKGPPDQP